MKRLKPLLMNTTKELFYQHFKKESGITHSLFYRCTRHKNPLEYISELSYVKSACAAGVWSAVKETVKGLELLN